MTSPVCAGPKSDLCSPALLLLLCCLSAKARSKSRRSFSRPSCSMRTSLIRRNCMRITCCRRITWFWMYETNAARTSRGAWYGNARVVGRKQNWRSHTHHAREICAAHSPAQRRRVQRRCGEKRAVKR